MEILCFKIRGKFAHFRKYYANNTAFSFSIPPRTTLMGIVAASLGWERDSYYEKLSSDNIKFGVRVLEPLKKSFHRINLLSIKSTGDLSKNLSTDFRGEGGRIQTPFEIVSGLNISQNDVIYQVFIMPEESGISTYNEIKNNFLNMKSVYNLSFGTANFNCHIYNVEIVDSKNIKFKSTEAFTEIHSAVPVHLITDLQFDKDDFNNYNFIEEDMMPGDYVENNNREVKKMNKLMFSITDNPLRLKLNSGYYELLMNDDELINIQFMDL